MALVKPRLGELPEELISNISIKLGSDDIFAFRLACKTLEQRSFHEFANEYFTNKAFMVTTDALKVLVQTSNSDKLSKYLRHIYVVPALFSTRAINCCHGNHCVWKPTVRHSEAMRGYIHDQKTLKESGRDLEMLTQSFKQLPNLQGLTFVDSWNNIPKSTDCRGLLSSTRKTNASATVLPAYPEDKEYYRWKNHVWKILIRAIADSQISTLAHFYTDLDTIKNTLSLASVNFEQKTLDALIKPFQSLKNVALQIRSLDPKKSTENSDGVDTLKHAHSMHRFASIMPSLERLSLQFQYTPSSGILCQNFTAGIDLSKLTRLKLDSMYIDAQSLGIMICKTAVVDDLQLVWINLTEGTWPTILEAIQKLKKVTHLHLMYLYEGELRVSFVKPNEQEGMNQSGPITFNELFGSDDSDELSDDDEDDESIPDEDDEDDEESDEDEDEESDEDDDSLPELEPLPGATMQPSVADDVPTSSSNIGGVQLDTPFEMPTEPAPSSPSDTTPDSLPDLEPQTDVLPILSVPAPPPPQTTTPNVNHNNHHGTNPHSHTTTNHIPPTGGSYGYDTEPGRYICLSGAKEIQAQLPTFIKEYNILDDEDDFMGGLPPPPPVSLGGPTGGGAGGTPNINNLINSIGAAFGMQTSNVYGNAHNGGATFTGPSPPGGAHPGQTVVIGNGNTVIGGFTVGGGVPPAPNANGGQATAGASVNAAGDESEWSTDDDV